MGVGGSRVTQGGLTWEALRQKRWRTTKTFPNEFFFSHLSNDLTRKPMPANLCPT